MWYVQRLGYYSALDRNEILLHTTAWMILEDILLSEINQTYKNRYCMIPILFLNFFILFIFIFLLC